MFAALHKGLTRLMGNNWVEMRNPFPLVSISFDDAPRSACLLGRSILEKQGALGTYYVAGGLTGHTEEGKPCHTLADLQSLASTGHELGCHTWGHRNLSRLSPGEIENEIALNGRFLGDLGCPVGNTNFSYPFGGIGLHAKLLCPGRYRSCRATGGGINAGRMNLAALRAVGLYSSRLDETGLRALLEETRRVRGWLILYSHDVEESPSRWGCTPALLDMALRLAGQYDCRVATVDAALALCLADGAAD